MKTTILGHEIEFSWEGGGKNELNMDDHGHIEEEIKMGNTSGQLCQESKENGEVENIGWWKIKSYKNEALKQMQKAEKLEYALDEIDGLLDNIETLMLYMPYGETEKVDDSIDGINNLTVIIKTKIGEAKK